MSQTEPTTESLLEEIAELRQEAEELRLENADLEMLMEMNTEHSDYLEEDLLKKVDATLRESEKRFRLITETIPVPILVTRLSDSTAVYLNEHLSVLLGLPAEKLLGNSALDFLYDNPDERQKLLDTLEKDGCLTNYELRGRKADNTPVRVALFSQLLMFNDEPCLLSALYDLTEHWLAKEEIRKLSEALEKRMKEREGKYLTFAMAGEEYGVSILKVREIIGVMPITSVPRTPDFMKGVINLRGRVIPVTDLRLKFGMDAADYTDRTCIIVADIEQHFEETGKTDVTIGMVVDSVSEVLNIRGTDIEETPELGLGSNTDYILGMARVNGKVKILINIDNLFDFREVSFLESKGKDFRFKGG